MRSAFSKTGFIEALALTLAIGSLLLFVTWQLASGTPDPDAVELQRDVDFLADQLQKLKERLDLAQAREAVLQQEADILRQANRLLREQESERQAELNTLHSELDFYRRLAGTGGAQTGPDVYHVELLATDSERVFQFVLTLTQNIRRASIISGRVQINVEGVLGDRPVTLYWSEVGGDAAEPAFRFKYFQQLEGYLALPEAFAPIRLLVTLKANGDENAVQRTFDWDVLLTASED